MNGSVIGLFLLMPAGALSAAAGGRAGQGFELSTVGSLGVSPVRELESPACGGAAVGPEYYRIPLVSTRRVLGSHYASGAAEVYHADSPFGVTVAEDGSYLRRLEIAVSGLQSAEDGSYVAWVTTPTLDDVERLGALPESHRLTGFVSWNKFLVVISLEPEGRPLGSRWSGPIVLRGMSKSGAMHTMAGHGPFQQENCAAYGFD